jgi:flagellar motor switch protein FliN
MENINNQGSPNIDLLMDVSLRVTVELGRTQMTLRQVLDLQPGSVVELDRLAGDPVDIFVNERIIARGEVVVVDDKFGVKITELVTPTDEIGERK